jgi:hypothetical protein
VDAHITGNILLVALVATMALLTGSKFKPFRFGAEWFEPVRLVWVEEGEQWVLERTLVQTGNFPPASNKGPVAVQEIYPISLSLVLGIGIAVIAYFIYTCAKRQTQLMVSVFAGEADRPYDRPWDEIRVTFWALDVALAFIVFFFLV